MKRHQPKKTCWRCGREYRREKHKLFKGKLTPTCPMCGATIRIKPKRYD